MASPKKVYCTQEQHCRLQEHGQQKPQSSSGSISANSQGGLGPDDQETG